MTNEQLVDQYQKGDKDALNQLVIKNEPLCIKLCSRWREHTSYDDIRQSARIGLLESAEKYNPELGFKFSTYAFRSIKNYISNFLRGEGRYLGRNSTLGDIHDSPEPSPYAMFIEDKLKWEDQPRLEDKEIYQLLYEAIDMLVDTQKEAIKELLTGLNQREIAHKFGVSRQAISSRVLAAQRHLSIRLKDCGYA